jgi:hypothetical protein
MKASSLYGVVQEEELERNEELAPASAKASFETGLQPAAEDGRPAGIGMATVSPILDVTVDGQDSSTSMFGKLDHPATTAMRQSAQTRPNDKVTKPDLESRSLDATTRAESEQQSTVDDNDSRQSPNKQAQNIFIPELEAFREHRMASASLAKPSERKNGWSSCGDDTTECWVKEDFKKKPWTTSVVMTQSSSTAMLDCGAEGLSGMLPVFCELSRWPEWFPFNKETSCLHVWEDGTELWHIKVKIAAFSIDLCIVTKVYDHLLDLGYVEIVTTTPAPDAKHVCGVPLPKKPWGCIRGECDKAIIRFTPTSMTECTVNVEFAGKEELPVEWVVKYLWSTLSKKVVPLIASQQDPWRKKGFFQRSSGRTSW